MSKIGLLFGSFNPIHNGHIHIAIEAISNKIVDKVWFVIAKQNPFKPFYEVPDEARIEMVRRSCSLGIGLYPCVDEFNKECTSTKTYDVLNYLRKIYNGFEFVIICGSDTYEEISKWYRGEDLLKESFYVVKRLPNSISSSEVRRRVKQGEDISTVVPLNVMFYIKKKQLYVNTTEV